MDDSTRDRWRSESTAYDVPHLRLRQVAELVNRFGPGRVVDIGCAGGYLRTLCPGVEYVGCDFVEPPGGVAFRFFLCDFNHQPLPAEVRAEEMIVCSGILEYIDDLPSFLARCRERLCAGGRLVATYFNPVHFSRRWTRFWGKVPPVHPDWRALRTPSQFRRTVAGAGFHLEGIFAMNHSLRGAVGVGATVDAPLLLPRARRWSGLLAHQFLYLVRNGSSR